MAGTLMDRQVEAVRAFNRFYTRRIGLLSEAILGSALSLPQMRVLWEVAHSDRVSAAWLQGALGMDAAYLSRILRGFREAGLVVATPDERDARVRRLRLTDKGRREFATFDHRSSLEVRRILDTMASGERAQLVAAMAGIRAVLEKRPFEGFVTRLRDPAPGDYGWVVERHGALYAQEYGWDESFEGFVAELVGRYVRDRKRARERCWIAEREGERVGCVFLVEKSRTVGQLRMLLVEPKARGHGVGRALVGECVRTARAIGYRTLMLWTNDVLHAARRIYQQEGFTLVKREKHRSYGHDLVGQVWELRL